LNISWSLSPRLTLHLSIANQRPRGNHFRHAETPQTSLSSQAERNSDQLSSPTIHAGVILSVIVYPTAHIEDKINKPISEISTYVSEHKGPWDEILELNFTFTPLFLSVDQGIKLYYLNT
jgi:hypothetical protein